MGVIQSSINSLLSTAAIASKLSPAAEERVEIRQAERREAKAAKVIDTVAKSETAYSPELVDNITNYGIEAAESLFKTNPTEENLQSWQTGLNTKKDIEQRRQSKLKAQQEAKARAQDWLAADQERVRNAEYFRKPIKNIIEDIKEIG